MAAWRLGMLSCLGLKEKGSSAGIGIAVIEIG